MGLFADRVFSCSFPFEEARGEHGSIFSNAIRQMFSVSFLLSNGASTEIGPGLILSTGGYSVGFDKSWKVLIDGEQCQRDRKKVFSP